MGKGPSGSRKGARVRLGKAYMLGGLLLFGTIFGAATLALRSGTIWPGAYDQGTFVFTNGYLTGDSANHIVVVTSDRGNHPLAGQRVVVSITNDSKHTLLTGKTDRNGMLAADVYVPPQSADTVLLSVEAAGETVARTMHVYRTPSYSGVFASESGSGGSGGSAPGSGNGTGTALPVRLYLSLDKPRYQPGQTIHLRTLCFREGAAVTEDVTYLVKDPSGNKLFRQTFPANRFGVTFFDYPISDILPLGNYTISANTSSATALKTVPIERYVLPKFSVSFGGLKSFYSLDDIIDVTLEADYFFGKPVEGTARVTARLTSQSFGWWRDSYGVNREILNTSVPVSQGRGEFTVPAARTHAGSPYSWSLYDLELVAAVTDTAGHTEKRTSSVTVSPQRFHFTCIAETNTPGQPTTLTVVVRDPVGGPLPGMQVKLIGAELLPPLATAVTDDRGLASLSIVYDFQGSARLSVSGGSPVSVRDQVVTLGSPNAVKVVPDRRFYEVGETATVTVLADPSDDFSGVAGIALADVVVNGAPVVQREAAFKDHRATFTFKVTKDMLPAFELRAAKLSVMSYERYWREYYRQDSAASYPMQFSDRYTMAQDRVSVGVGLRSELDVSVAASKASLRPGEEVELFFTTMDGETPVSAALAVAIVDEALLSMGGGSAFDEIRQDLSQDPGYQQYSIYSYIWGESAARRAPMFSASMFADYAAPAGLLQYSSMNKSEDTVTQEPDPGNVTKLSLAMALFGVLGYFGVIGLGIMYRRTAVALLAGSLLLVAAVPLALEDPLTPKPLKYADSSQQLSFNQTTGDRYQYYPKYAALTETDSLLLNSPLSPPPAAERGSAVGEVKAPTYQSGGGQASPGGTGALVAPSKAITVRSWFPELWYWNPMVLTDETGRASLKLNAPDSITTWRIDTLASTEDARIGVGNGSLVVFQPFFVDPDLPVSVVRNDRFTFRVAIYNYEQSEQTVSVRLARSDWFQVIGTDQVTAVVAAGTVRAVQFTIKALKVGEHPLTVSGSTATREDIVTRELRVEPDGRLVEDIRNGLLQNTTSVDLLFTQDGARIAGSENAYLKLQASVESIIIDGAEGFIHCVHGCGEQSTSILSVDILAYQNYLKGDVDQGNLSRYRDTIYKGIQHEAQYLSTDTGGHGRAIVWHAGERPDLWLTAWAIQAYRNLQEAGFDFDDRIIPDLQAYLVSAQAADGSWDFPDVGHWSINSELEGSDLAATAYVLRALMISGMSPSGNAAVKARSFLEANAASLGGDFARALSLDALELSQGSGSVRGALVQELISSAIEDGNGAYHWSYAEQSPGRHYRSDNTVETTGYAVMALARAGAAMGLVQGGAKHLVLSRSGGGYWGSTHNTAVAFTALNSLSEITPIKEMTVEVLVDGTRADTVSIDQSNKDLTFLTDLRPWFVSGDGPVSAGTVTVTIRSAGEGGVFYHLYTKQHIEWAQVPPDPAPALALSVGYSSTDATVGTQLSATAVVSYNGPAKGLQMVLVDLRAPTGFVLDENNFDDLQSRGVISFYEFRGGGRALAYIDALGQGQSRRLEYTLTAMSPATSLLQHVNAFDMYNTTLAVELPPVLFSAA